MSAFWLEMVGMLAGFLMAISFIPQNIKTIKTKDTASLSLPTYILYVSSVTTWFVYGFLAGSFAIMFWNAITFLFAGTILVMKIKHG